MKMQYRLAKDTKELDRQIELAIEACGTMRKRVQVAAVSILYHTWKHGDYTKANELVHGLGDGVNGKALVEFFVLFGGLLINEEATEFNGWSGPDHIKENFQKAKDTMWWTLKKENPFAGYSVDKELLKVVKGNAKARKALDALPEDDPKRKLYDMEASDATMRQVISLCDFRRIIGGGEDVTEEAPNAAEAG